MNEKEGREPVDEATLKVIRERALPGALVFDKSGRLLYISTEARKILTIINSKNHISEEVNLIPDEIHSLYETAREKTPSLEPENHCPAGTFFCNGQRYAIRAFDLFETNKDEVPECVMIIIDKCALGRSATFDYRRVKARFGLTDRELQVTEAITRGDTNQEISKALSISEHTVKDYVKKIIRKLDVKNRSSILCKIIE